ncbi:HEXXH motif domain-containing protein [Micromonospora sp. RHAY321]|uniref:HEXXH motif domain-containing protein n=1 Tax=Micromonospora sp. RHAY321 TaxID=2944807 RepID=UPI00207CFC1A|nr:HEXXH motif domain-containing protein [Micromonospora sp. RHAY321]MCO1597015.1 HEXXH motif domain-containing protein [Micromonospora sp. RHAY321]
MASDPVPLGPTYLEPEHFHALASGGGAERTVEALWRSERSWRLIVLRVLLDSCATRPDAAGPLAPVADAWQLLVQAHGAAPDVTEDVLARPQVGIWAAHTLRRLRDDSDLLVPLWLDVGYLHALAAASAVRAGLSFDLDIPVRDGAAVLPTVGSASIASAVPVVRVRARDGQVDLVTGGRTVRCVAGDPDWHEPIIVEAAADGVGLRVELLDRDVYRDLRGPSSPQPLSAPEIARWRACLAQAWELLVSEQRGTALAIAGILRTVAPLPRRDRFRQLSASGAEAFGGVLLSEPDDAAQLAVTLVHESQHHKLGALSHLLALSESGGPIRYYAPWRDDPRPLAGVLQGAYAFAGITRFWRVHRHHAPPTDRPAADFEFALWRRQTLGVLRLMAASGRLTTHGQRFVETLHAELETCQEDAVPVAALDAAHAVALDHRAMWRGHNVCLDPADRDALAVAWQRRDPAAEAVLAIDGRKVLVAPPEGLLDARAVLRRYLLVDPDEFGRLCASPEEVGARVAGATPADLTLVAGDVERARAGYLGELRQDPSSVHGWVGLGLTQIDRPADPATRALLCRPELVLAVVHGLRSRGHATVALDPIELADWVGRGVPDQELDTFDPAGWLAV